MKYTIFVTIVVMMIFVSSSESGDTKSCIPIGEKCDAFHSELCSTRYCRNHMCIKFGTVYDDSETTDPCRNHNCPHGQICTYNQVQCFRAPCGPVMDCVDKSSTPCPS